ncbi:MAG: hypothetical protein ACPGUH_02285 [Winogradskyella sp.]
MKNKHFYMGIVLIISVALNAQRKNLKAQLIANGDVEGIHILNKTASKYAISNENGRFSIPAKALDTLFISGLKYQVQDIVITKAMIDLGSFKVQLIEKINELDEVIVGKILTGSLQSDLENSDAKPKVNFYDLGIPGYTGKPLTQNERKLHDADAGSMLSLGGGTNGAGAGVNLHKLLNKISGRTKKLKAIVALETKDNCINRLRREFKDAIFENNDLAENLKNEYFFFCDEDPKFKQLCEENNDLKSIDFLKQKLIAYKQIVNTKTKK